MSTTRIEEIRARKAGQEPKVNPKLFMMWLVIIASIMLFAGFTSAYLVHRPDSIANNDWLQFELPQQFMYSCGIVLLSSVFMFMAWKSAKNDEISSINLWLAVTILSGIAFTVSQVWGFNILFKQNLSFVPVLKGGISASFVWVIAGIHLLHAGVGVLLLTYTLVRSFQLKVHKKNMLLINIVSTYWHFVGVLWIYLFLFLYFAG